MVVAIRNFESPKQTMICGILQRSSLGPLLFLIYINGLPNYSNPLAYLQMVYKLTSAINMLELLILNKYFECFEMY